MCQVGHLLKWHDVHLHGHLHVRSIFIVLFDEERSESRSTWHVVFIRNKDRRIRRSDIIICFQNLRGHKFKHYRQQDAVVTRGHAFISTDSTQARPKA